MSRAAPISLRWRLRWLVTAALAAVLLPLGIFSFNATLRELDELSDGRLAQAAHTLELMVRQTGLDALQAPPRTTAGTASRELVTIPLGGRTFESEVGFQLADTDGAVRLATANFTHLPAAERAEAGFRDIRLDGYRWRLYTLHDPVRGVTIRAGERYDSRHDIIRALLLDHALPLLIGLPLIALLVGWAVQRGLRPLERLAQTLAARPPGAREPITLASAPSELRPVLDALNEQLGRLEDALERERRFSADVAHELRTPLTTSLISVESAMAGAHTADGAAALGHAQQALVLLARRVEQLLMLARLEAGAAAGGRASVDLRTVAEAVIDELTPLLSASPAELSLRSPGEPVRVSGFSAGLAALMRNLVENALRHVPDGGRVQLAIGEDGEGAYIEVTDDGPGIPPERRAEVFARFHRDDGSRGDGYGLGLSIVQRVAQLHGAGIALLDAPWGRGLRVRVCFGPAVAAGQSPPVQ